MFSFFDRFSPEKLKPQLKMAVNVRAPHCQTISSVLAGTTT